MRAKRDPRAAQLSQEHIYFVDITTLTPDGTVIPGLQGKLSADEPVSVSINGDDIVIRPEKVSTSRSTVRVGLELVL
jgi:hypothetical protein